MEEKLVVTIAEDESKLSLIPAHLLRACASQHARLCPRQVLGLRIGLLAGDVLGIGVPRVDKRLLAIAETDGCAVDGILVATGCTVGRRTLKVMDFGKVAATFIDSETTQTIRIVPRPGIRQAAMCLIPGAKSRWHAQLEAYQFMPSTELMEVYEVQLNFPLEDLIGQPGRRAVCAECGEEIINRREIVQAGRIVCQSCAGHGYYSNSGLSD